MANSGLYELIDGLSAAEKRIVSIELQSKSAKSNNFYSLFKSISAKSIENDKVLIQYLGKGAVKNLAATKHQLYHKILNVLGFQNQVFESTYYQTALKIEFLLSKELYKQAIKMIKKLKVEVAIHERFLFTTDLYFKEIKAYVGLKDYTKCFECFEDFKKNEPTFSRDSSMFLKAYNDYYKINLHYRQSGAARSVAEFTVYNDFIRLKEEEMVLENSWNSTNFFNLQALSRAYFSIGEYDKSNNLTVQLIEMFEKVPEEKNSDLKQYLGVLYNYIVGLIFQKHFEEFEKYMTVFKEVKPRNLNEEIFVKERYYNLRLMKHLMSAEYVEASNLIEEFEVDYKRPGFNLSPTIKPLILGINTAVSLNLGAYKKALFWNNEILNTKDFTQLRDDIIFATELFEIIIHYELNNYRLLEYRLVAFYKKMKSKNKLLKIEVLLIKAYEQLVNTNVQKVRNEIFYNLGIELEKCKDDPFEKNLLSKFDFITYFKSKIS